MPFQDNSTLEEAWNKSTYVMGDSIQVTIPLIDLEYDITIVNSVFYGSCSIITPKFNFTQDSGPLQLFMTYNTTDMPEGITVQIHDLQDG